MKISVSQTMGEGSQQGLAPPILRSLHTLGLGEPKFDHLCTLGPKVSIICMLGAVGIDL